MFKGSWSIRATREGKESYKEGRVLINCLQSRKKQSKWVLLKGKYIFLRSGE